jgi:hypothetical protein
MLTEWPKNAAKAKHTERSKNISIGCREGGGYFPHWLKLKLTVRLYYGKGDSVNKRWMIRLKLQLRTHAHELNIAVMSIAHQQRVKRFFTPPCLISRKDCDSSFNSLTLAFAFCCPCLGLSAILLLSESPRGNHQTIHRCSCKPAQHQPNFWQPIQQFQLQQQWQQQQISQ